MARLHVSMYEILRQRPVSELPARLPQARTAIRRHKGHSYAPREVLTPMRQAPIGLPADKAYEQLIDLSYSLSAASSLSNARQAGANLPRAVLANSKC